MPRRNFLLRLAYDGSAFFGWQRQKGQVRTVQAEVEAALSRLLGENVEVTGAGRTDAGVHAEAQGASFHSRTGLSCEEIAEAVGRELPPDIACTGCREVDPRFHARFRAKEKTYRYSFALAARVRNALPPEVGGCGAAVGTGGAAGPRPAWARPALDLREALDAAAMAAAASLFVGPHDFRAFTNAPRGTDCGRTIADARVEAGPGFVDFSVSAEGFLANQVRIMAAALLEAGRGRLSLSDIRNLLGGAERKYAPGMLPACGLSLVDVRY